MYNVLIVYNEDCTNIDDTLKEFNSIHTNIQNTMEKQINSLLTPGPRQNIVRQYKRTTIYRKDQESVEEVTRLQEVFTIRIKSPDSEDCSHISKYQQLKKKSAATALNTVLASAHTQMT
jgi:ferritin-like metal-binding protein YciE